MELPLNRRENYEFSLWAVMLHKVINYEYRVRFLPENRSWGATTLKKPLKNRYPSSANKYVRLFRVELTTYTWKISMEKLSVMIEATHVRTYLECLESEEIHSFCFLYILNPLKWTRCKGKNSFFFVKASAFSSRMRVRGYASSSTSAGGLVVQSPISSNPGVNSNPTFFISLFKSLFGKIFTILFRTSNDQIASKKIWTEFSLKIFRPEIKFLTNPGLP